MYENDHSIALDSNRISIKHQAHYSNNTTDVMTELGVFYKIVPKRQLKLLSSPNWLKLLIQQSRPVWQPYERNDGAASNPAGSGNFSLGRHSPEPHHNMIVWVVCSRATFSSQPNKPEASEACWVVGQCESQLFTSHLFVTLSSFFFV